MYPKHWIFSIILESTPSIQLFPGWGRGNELPALLLPCKAASVQFSPCCRINQLLLQDSPSLLSLMLVLEAEVEGL